jgi:uncharacterized membrane protein YgdD (TMEM256/DUF423 family)
MSITPHPSDAQRSRFEAWAVAGFGASAVALGALGAHALQGHLSAALLGVWHTAVEYQFWHALALALVVLAVPAGRARQVARNALMLGMLLFCGSLYALALGAPRWIGLITPFGGVALIVGWLALGAACLRRPG